MDFTRRFMFELGCGVVGVAGIVLAVIAYRGYADISKQLGEAAALGQQIAQIARSPDGQAVNREALEAEGARNTRIDQQYEQVRKTAEEMNRRRPLRDDVFPAPPPSRQDAPYLFRRDYRQAFNKLLEDMKAGDIPSQDEVDAMRMLIEQEQRVPEDELLGLEGNLGGVAGLGGAGVSLPRPSAHDVKPEEKPGESGSYGSYGRPYGSYGTSYAPSYATGVSTSQMSPEDRARTDPVVRASIAKAKQIRTYAALDSFDVVDTVYADGPQPSLVDLWIAQLKLWVQEDVARGLAEANEARARELKAYNDQQSDANKRLPIDVTTLPVKHLVSMTVSDYIVAGQAPVSGRLAAGGMGSGKPGGDYDDMKSYGGGRSVGTGSAAASFTQRGCNDVYDVVQFQVQMVVDSRELLRVINAMCKQNFLTPLRIGYEAVEPNVQMIDYIYGSGPVVLVTADFEAYFFQELYKPLMPEAMKTARTEMLTGPAAGPMGAQSPSKPESGAFEGEKAKVGRKLDVDM